MVIRPVFKWSNTDIWDFIKYQNVKYCRLYDAGYTRLGCVGCPLLSKKQRLNELQKHNWAMAWWRNAAGIVARARQEQGKSNLATQDAVFDWWLNQP